MNQQSFIDKYRPTSLSDVVGHDKKLKQIRKKAEDNSPVILYGDAGTGKTSTAEALAHENGWNVVEINASSARTKSDIISIAQQIRSGSIDGNKTVFILDELDSMDGRSLTPLTNVLEDPPNPVVGTANELWKVPNSLENKCTTYKFSLGKDDMKPFLKEVAKKECINITSRQLGQLATRNGLRDALNDLQRFSESDSDTGWDDRETEDSPFAVTERILRGKDYIGGRNMTPPDMVDFIDENMPGEFAGVEILRAYQALSEADKLHERVFSEQDYRWWRYSGTMTEDVANLRLSEPYDGWMNINYPSARRQSSPYPNQDSSDVALYEEIKDVETPNFRCSFNFSEFKNAVLPILKDMDSEDKYRLILSESFSDDAIDALGVSRSVYDSWLAEEDDVETMESKDLSEDEVEEDENRSIFDL